MNRPVAVVALVAAVLAAVPGMLLHPGPLTGQTGGGGASGGVARAEAPAPAIHLRWTRGAAGAGPLLVARITPPDGWELYAPGNGEPGPVLLGLPLELRWADGDPVAVTRIRPAPDERRVEGGRVRVYREPLEMTLHPPGPAAGPLEVRWALCREDLCIPGRTRAEIPPRPAVAAGEPGDAGNEAG